MSKPNPDNKRRADGKIAGGEAVQRRAKVYKATGEVTKAHMEVGNGSQKLSAARIWRMLFGDDE